MARSLARVLDYQHVDTGAMYRAVAWKAEREGLSLADEVALAALARRAELQVDGGTVAIDGHDVTREIRTAEIDAAAAAMARLQAVREVLVARQRGMAAAGGVVMEGRDIGTVVFPQADVKIYLDASEEERARRRVHDPTHSGGKAGTVAVAASLQARDRSDTTRKVSPLTQADDAHYIDTTSMPIEVVVNHILGVVRRVMVSPA